MSHPIEFEDVYRHFGQSRVLRGLSLTVRQGQAYALLGRNGAGKTTALRILLGFLEPIHGHSSLLSRDSRRFTPSDREDIGYVPEGQRPYARMSMRVPQLIDFEAATRERFRRTYFEDAVRRFELPTDRAIARLSRGQQAQLALLSALAGQPKVLVFDDPAMGLDVVMRREFLNSVIEYMADEGISILFSSHILNDVERVADRVGILHQGRLIVDASVDDLKRRVQKRHLRLAEGQRPDFSDLGCVLRERKVSAGLELTLLDLDQSGERALAEHGQLSRDALVPSLEELFCALTGEQVTPEARSEANTEKGVPA